MPAKSKNIEALAVLEDNWDGYGGKAPTGDALNAAAEDLWFVPVADGGIQIEIHSNGSDIEIRIGPDGVVRSVSFERP